MLAVMPVKSGLRSYGGLPKEHMFMKRWESVEGFPIAALSHQNLRAF